MKQCSLCTRVYHGDEIYCPRDATILQEIKYKRCPNGHSETVLRDPYCAQCGQKFLE